MNVLPVTSHSISDKHKLPNPNNNQTYKKQKLDISTTPQYLFHEDFVVVIFSKCNTSQLQQKLIEALNKIDMNKCANKGISPTFSTSLNITQKQVIDEVTAIYNIRKVTNIHL